ncbi:hypothetical protein U537_00908 [Staphylococcus aureus F88387]|nr:hypothetical protein U035_00681 [Staphylococcus aureus KINW6061]EVF70413.1 hypothetical protein T842_00975 [Staphylococcus aureus PLAC6004]EWI22356.1 hypothetical protein U516_00682 [Staphylococcus aureus F23347]EWI42969.1 hypothetical protein U690_00906 [Staphylococcus aureus W33578]EWL36316.1 hypothetical protein U537_00908 [Staphylococcus aureus F88387]EWT22807.1 hypothetical protein V237_01365 [Staphylococcus aureus T74141]EWV55057.1 hypothetical protein V227_00635 [Staphylococcus aure
MKTLREIIYDKYENENLRTLILLHSGKAFPVTNIIAENSTFLIIKTSKTISHKLVLIYKNEIKNIRFF